MTFFITRPPEDVWAFTQDYGRRAEWDAGVTEATLLGTDPRRVRVKLRGVGTATFEYKMDRRPERTSLGMVDVESRWFAGGGGSWEYLADAAGTRWTQTNTLVLKHGRLLAWAGPIIRAMVRSGTRRAMRRAKAILEAPPAEG